MGFCIYKQVAVIWGSLAWQSLELPNKPIFSFSSLKHIE
jgi:hypothetical protein